jgi:hypothetical protein
LKFWIGGTLWISLVNGSVRNASRLSAQSLATGCLGRLAGWLAGCLGWLAGWLFGLSARQRCADPFMRG